MAVCYDLAGYAVYAHCLFHYIYSRNVSIRKIPIFPKDMDK